MKWIAASGLGVSIVVFGFFVDSAREVQSEIQCLKLMTIPLFLCAIALFVIGVGILEKSK